MKIRARPIFLRRLLLLAICLLSFSSLLLSGRVVNFPLSPFSSCLRVPKFSGGRRAPGGILQGLSLNLFHCEEYAFQSPLFLHPSQVSSEHSLIGPISRSVPQAIGRNMRILSDTLCAGDIGHIGYQAEERMVGMSGNCRLATRLRTLKRLELLLRAPSGITMP